MSYSLFLDDVRNPIDCFEYTKQGVYLMDCWVIARNYDDFVKTITDNGVPDVISFDHDLADEHYRPSMYDPDKHYTKYYTDGTFKEKTGYHCAEWFLNYCLDNDLEIPKLVYIHSMNPIGGENIKSLFHTYNKVHGK